MCTFYDSTVPKQCSEDGAEEVIEKDRVNFCEWFKPGYDVFDAARVKKEAEAKDVFASLFGQDDTPEHSDEELVNEADRLFK
jgi:hypothetical protein